MKPLALALIILSAFGCNTNRVVVNKARTSPDGRWVIASEFDYREGRSYEVLRDANGAAVARTKGMLVDLPTDFAPDDLFITNESAGIIQVNGTQVVLWKFDANADIWTEP